MFPVLKVARFPRPQRFDISRPRDRICPPCPPVDLITALRKRNPAHDGPLGVAHWQLVDDAVTGQGGFLAALRDLRVYDYGPGGVVGGSTVARVRTARPTCSSSRGRPRTTSPRGSREHVRQPRRAGGPQLHGPALVGCAGARDGRGRRAAVLGRPDAGLGKIDAWVAAARTALRHGGDGAH